MIGIRDNGEPRFFSFVLMPEFSMLALTAVIEPLRHANLVLGKEQYRWMVYSEAGTPIISSSGLGLDVRGDLHDVDRRSVIFIFGGRSRRRNTSPRMLNWLKGAARHSPMIGGLCTAAQVLADARLLDGYRATIHWESLNAFREVFPRVDVRESLFEVDRDRMTCAGDTACIDLMVTLLAAEHGSELATLVSEKILHTRIRQPEESQRLALKLRLGMRNFYILRGVELMEANIEDPLDIGVIAGQLGRSRRQIERLFRSHLKCAPMEYYRNLRLDRARRLLLETELSYLEVAIACGFKSDASLSRAYRGRFGILPRDERGIPQLAVQENRERNSVPGLLKLGDNHRRDRQTRSCAPFRESVRPLPGSAGGRARSRD